MGCLLELIHRPHLELRSKAVMLAACVAFLRFTGLEGDWPLLMVIRGSLMTTFWVAAKEKMKPNVMRMYELLSVLMYKITSYARSVFLEMTLL